MLRFSLRMSAFLLLSSCVGEVYPAAPVGCGLDNPQGTAWLTADQQVVDLGVLADSATGSVTLKNDGHSALGIEAIVVRTASGAESWSASFEVGPELEPPVQELVAVLDPGETLVVELTATPESAVDLGALLVSTRSATRHDVFRDPVGPVLTIPLIAGLEGGEVADLLGAVIDLEQRSVTMGESACLQIFAAAPATPECAVSTPDGVSYDPVVTPIAVGEHEVLRLDYELGFDISVPDGVAGRVVPYDLACEVPDTEHSLGLTLSLAVLSPDTTWEDDYP